MNDYFDGLPLDDETFNEFWYKLDHYPEDSGFQQMRISTRASTLRVSPSMAFVDPRTQELKALHVDDWNLHRRTHASDFSGWPEALAEAPLPKLVSLAFGTGNIGAIDALGALKSLKYLELGCTSDLVSDLSCASLETLRLPALTEAALVRIMQADGLHCPHLRHLNLAAGQRDPHKAVIPAEAVLELFRQNRFPKLRHLVISNIRACDGFFSKLAGTPLLAHLNELCLLGDFEEEATDDLVKVGFGPFAHLHAWELSREIDRDRFDAPNMRRVSVPTRHFPRWPPRVERALKPHATERYAPSPEDDGDDEVAEVEVEVDDAAHADEHDGPDEPTNESKNDIFRRKLTPIAAKLDVEFGDRFLEYVRRVWHELPEWFRTPDEWRDLRAFCLDEFGLYDGHGGVIIGEGAGGDLRVARRNDARVVSHIIEWIPHEDILGFEKHRKKRPVAPVGFNLGDRVVHEKLGAGEVIWIPKPGFSLVRWDTGGESKKLSRFLKHE